MHTKDQFFNEISYEYLIAKLNDEEKEAFYNACVSLYKISVSDGGLMYQKRERYEELFRYINKLTDGKEKSEKLDIINSLKAFTFLKDGNDDVEIYRKTNKLFLDLFDRGEFSKFIETNIK